MSALERLNELHLKYDGRVPQDELEAALGSKVTDWADARLQQNYFEDRMLLNWRAMETETHPAHIESRLESHEYFIQQAKEWRAKTEAYDWQRQALAAE